MAFGDNIYRLNQPAFRILIVDDTPADVRLLAELMKNLHHPHEEYAVTNGVEALDFLYRRGKYVHVPRPNMILLDMNMPGLSGLEVLAAVKGDPQLSVIPVLMLSTSSSPEDVHRCYQSHANVYVQKPRDLEHSQRLIQAIEAFWMDFAVLPSLDEPVIQAPSRSNGHTPPPLRMM